MTLSAFFFFGIKISFFSLVKVRIKIMIYQRDASVLLKVIPQVFLRYMLKLQMSVRGDLPNIGRWREASGCILVENQQGQSISTCFSLCLDILLCVIKKDINVKDFPQTEEKNRPLR